MEASAPTTLNYLATAIFALAIIHTFMAGAFNKLAAKYPEGSMQEDLYHFLGEIEVVFGIWLFPLFYAVWYFDGLSGAIQLFDNATHSMEEPVFVVVIMVMAATRPVLLFTKQVILQISRIVPIPSPSARFYFAVLVVTPMLGSFITEPAAMTISAIMLAQNFYVKDPRSVLKYATISLLFVNISIGGTFTNFAAPPVLMVAKDWGWDLAFMASHFGWKALVAIFIGTTLTVTFFIKEFRKLDGLEGVTVEEEPVPWWVISVHLFSLFWAVAMVHHPVLLILGFLFFIGWCTISSEYQDELKIQPALLVGFFLAGLVIHGKQQGWWIQPLIASLDSFALFVGSTILTAFNDNAAITFLSKQALPATFSDVLSPEGIKKYAVVAGAVTGGGLTIIANAPNPAGNSILKKYFGSGGVNPGKLALYSLPPTIIAAICFLIL